MAQVQKPEEIPFSWIFGATIDIDLRDVALAFAVFYRSFQRGNLENVDVAMKGAAGGSGFEISFGKLTHQLYRDALLTSFREWLATRQPVHTST